MFAFSPFWAFPILRDYRGRIHAEPELDAGANDVYEDLGSTPSLVR